MNNMTKTYTVDNTIGHFVKLTCEDTSQLVLYITKEIEKLLSENVTKLKITFHDSIVSQFNILKIVGEY